jgi:hypothetical protein
MHSVRPWMMALHMTQVFGYSIVGQRIKCGPRRLILWIIYQRLDKPFTSAVSPVVSLQWGLARFEFRITTGIHANWRVHYLCLSSRMDCGRSRWQIRQWVGSMLSKTAVVWLLMDSLALRRLLWTVCASEDVGVMHQLRSWWRTQQQLNRKSIPKLGTNSWNKSVKILLSR